MPPETAVDTRIAELTDERDELRELLKELRLDYELLYAANTILEDKLCNLEPKLADVTAERDVLWKRLKKLRLNYELLYDELEELRR